MKSLSKHHKPFVKALFRLERCGKYEEALSELEDIWNDKSEFPDISGLGNKEAAELLLRCGSIFGFLGHNKQIANTQETSKNLIFEARRRFIDLADAEKITECENYLALAYWRTGEIIEAGTWIETALSNNLAESSQIGLYSHIIRSMILFAEGKFHRVKSELESRRRLIEKYGDSFLIGSFYTNLGLCLKNLQEPDEALQCLKFARIFHRKSGHEIYLGTVENNLAQLFKILNKPEKAHEAIDNATNIFRSLNDRTREGFSLDTKAQIFFDEGKFSDALSTIDIALEIMLSSENAVYLVETYLTKSKILLAMDDFPSATLCLFDGVHIAKTRISEEAARNLVNEFERELRGHQNSSDFSVFAGRQLVEGDLVLAIPPSISHYRQYQAVRIRNTHLEKIGLKKNSLAIVVDEEVNRGDLAAVMEIEDGSVYCGRFDMDFGIVCLEGFDSEPYLLNDNEVKILGKIVGYCDTEFDENGKLIVKEL